MFNIQRSIFNVQSQGAFRILLLKVAVSEKIKYLSDGIAWYNVF